MTILFLMYLCYHASFS